MEDRVNQRHGGQIDSWLEWQDRRQVASANVALYEVRLASWGIRNCTSNEVLSMQCTPI